MKRVMIAAMLLLGSASIFASEGKCVTVSAERKIAVNREEACTVSVDGHVRAFGMSMRVVCTASSATGCRAAVAEAKKCLDEVKKVVNNMM